MPNIEPLTNTHNAKLPQSYEQAKHALSKCYKVDECKAWQDKAAALASYAKQAGDKTLEKLAKRIRNRAVRRATELAEKFPTGKGVGKDQESKKYMGNHKFSNRREALLEAGWSHNQIQQMGDIAALSENEFEEMVEAEEPATLTELATAGKKKKQKEKQKTKTPEELEQIKNFKKVTHFTGRVWMFSVWCKENNPIEVTPHFDKEAIEDMKEAVHILDKWLDKLIVNLPEE